MRSQAASVEGGASRRKVLVSSRARGGAGAAQARFVANSFVRLAGYYLTGIPNSSVKPDVVHAREMFEAALQLTPDYLPALNGLGQAMLVQWESTWYPRSGDEHLDLPRLVLDPHPPGGGRLIERRLFDLGLEADVAP